MISVRACCPKAARTSKAHLKLHRHRRMRAYLTEVVEKIGAPATPARQVARREGRVEGRLQRRGRRIGPPRVGRIGAGVVRHAAQHLSRPTEMHMRDVYARPF
jgi:hypothetical protein